MKTPKIPLLDTIPRDKLAHALGGAILQACLYPFWWLLIWLTPNIDQYSQLSHHSAALASSIISVYIIAAWKERLDAKTPGRHSEVADILATVAGALIVTTGTLPWFISEGVKALYG